MKQSVLGVYCSMPFYTNLKISPNESELSKKRKERTVRNIKKLRRHLSAHFKSSRKKDIDTSTESKTIKIATWNIREFGKSNYKGRKFEEHYYIAEILSHFELIALQEVRSNLRELKDVLRILGPDWDYIATDVTDGKAGNGERMVFLYNINFVSFQNVAGELSLADNDKVRASFGERMKLTSGTTLNLNEEINGVFKGRVAKKGSGYKLAADLEIPLEKSSEVKIATGASLTIKKNTLIKANDKVSLSRAGRGKVEVTVHKKSLTGADYAVRLPPNTLDDSYKQFARSPFIISFKAGWLSLNLCTVHIYYGDSSDKNKLEQRRREIETLTNSLARKAENEFKQDQESFLCVLGDFNIIGKGHPTMDALESNGFEIPEKLKSIPGSNVAKDKAYDQIAFWKPNSKKSYSKLDILGANVFDFFKYVFKDGDEDEYRKEAAYNGLKPSSDYEKWRTYKMSDHLPMWIELRTNFNNEYLNYLEKRNKD